MICNTKYYDFFFIMKSAYCIIMNIVIYYEHIIYCIDDNKNHVKNFLIIKL